MSGAAGAAARLACEEEVEERPELFSADALDAEGDDRAHREEALGRDAAGRAVRLVDDLRALVPQPGGGWTHWVDPGTTPRCALEALALAVMRFHSEAATACAAALTQWPMRASSSSSLLASQPALCIAHTAAALGPHTLCSPIWVWFDSSASASTPAE